MIPAVKICGVTREADALCAARAGAHAVGLVFYPPSPRAVGAERANAIVRVLPPFITAVGLFVNPAPAYVRETAARVQLDLLQFHGDESPDFCEQFGLPYIKAVRVRPGVDLLECASQHSNARGLLLDAYVDGTHGGTGTRFDWDLVPTALPLPIVLSGGLEAANVAEAIRAVRPWAVDVSSGVEASKGIKDPAKIAAFMKGVRNACL
jgi:phosphoribosylanthranilate isomerase